MRADGAAPGLAPGTAAKSTGNAKRIQRCGSCGKQSVCPYCPRCLASYPMLRFLLPTTAGVRT